jgi:hypothetical protein
MPTTVGRAGYANIAQAWQTFTDGVHDQCVSKYGTGPALVRPSPKQVVDAGGSSDILPLSCLTAQPITQDGRISLKVDAVQR